MRIELVVAQWANKQREVKSRLLDEIQYKVVRSYKEANKLVPKCIDRNTYSMFMAFERNRDFVKLVHKLREERGLAKNSTYTTWGNTKLVKGESLQEIYKDTQYFKKSILEKFNIPLLIRDSIKTIVLGSFVYIPLQKLQIVSEQQLVSTYSEYELNISFSGRVSKNELKKFIEENYKKLAKEMEVFDQDVSFFISDRDISIYDLREEQNLQFKEIADHIAEKEEDFSINEDSVKTAYHRTKEKIYSINK